MNNIKKPENYPSIFSLKYLPIRLVFILLRLIVLLPLPIIFGIGNIVGFIMFLILRKRYRIALRNLELCYPNKTDKERKKIVFLNFLSMGKAIFETGMAWYWSDARIKKHMIVSEESIKNIMDNREHGQLVLTLHFLDLEMQARMYGMFHPGVGVYKPNKNPIVEYEQTKGRTRTNKYMVSHHNIKAVLRALMDKNPIWYAADQDYNTDNKVFVPFMAVKDCPTITSPSTIAKFKGVVSIPSYAYRIGYKYKLVVEKKLEGYPSGDLEKDATLYNKLMADAINLAPEQYMWVHRRFATRPNKDDPSYYSDSIVNIHKKKKSN